MNGEHPDSPRHAGRETGRHADRGQTTLDYAVGVGLFIVAVIFVVTFIPAMFEPFATGTQENTVVADRTATQLTTGMLTSPSSPYSLSVDCTTDFFNGTGTTTVTGCGFDDTKSFASKMGLSSFQQVNVSVRGDIDDDGTTHVLCVSTLKAMVEQSNQGSKCATSFIDGDSPVGAETVTIARRAVTFQTDTNTYSAMLEVKLWS